MNQKNEPVTPPSQEDKESVKQWKRYKAAETAKKVCINMLCGMANGLTMYGRAMPILFLPPAPPITPEHFSPQTKKY